MDGLLTLCGLFVPVDEARGARAARPYVVFAAPYADARIAPARARAYGVSVSGIKREEKEVVMNLVRWEPFASFDNLFGRLPSLPRWQGFPEFGGDAKFEWTPSVNISETDKEYLIRAELPAVKKEDVKVTLEGGMLTVSGERKQREEEKKEKFHRVETFHGSFSRSFALPDIADGDAIRAESKDGIVTIHVPKVRAEAKKATEIRIQ